MASCLDSLQLAQTYAVGGASTALAAAKFPFCLFFLPLLSLTHHLLLSVFHRA